MDWIFRKRKNRSLLNLHDDILATIFTRLSISTILECKRVCKSLYIFLSSRYFAESYQSNPPFTSLIIHTGTYFALLELNSGYNYSLKSSKPKILPDPFGLSYCGWRTRFLVGSCNGFFCYSDKDVLYVSNPLSGTHVRLPEVVLDSVSKSSYGFGFCPQTQQYKVIELASYVRPFSRTEVSVFTVGIDKFWRRVQSPFQHIQQRLDKTYPIIQFLELNGKGALHWIVDDSNRLDYLYSFDINKEKVVPIPPPVGLKKRNKSTLLLFMHGCVCLLHMNENEERVEFWCMTDYMVQGSWTLRIISQSSFPKCLTYSQFHPVTVWNYEEILMIYQGNYIVSCDLEQKNFNMLDIALVRSLDHAAVCFIPNFFSYLETGTTESDTKDAAARKLGLLSQKKSKPTEVGNGRARIMENILSRVFNKCCKDVCKIWCKFLSDPTVHLILCDKASPRFLFELKSNLNNNVKACPLLAATPSMAKITVLGSCNGLVCLSVFNDHHPDHQTHNIYICNPFVQEFAILPRPVGVKRIRDEAYGFGFSSMTGHYKVLRILTRKRRPGQFEAYVVTIGIDKNWRQVVVGGGGTTFRMPKKWPDNINKARFCDVPFNNTIHWIAEGDSKVMIYAFDIDEEQFSLLSPVPGMFIMEYKYVYPCLGILGECLCVCVIQPQGRNVVELWSMRTYGSVASWTRESISISYPRLRRRVVLPVMSWRDEEILMWVKDGGGTLISYCSKEKRRTETKIDIAANNEVLIAVPYVQSFLSLKDAFQNGDLEVNKIVIQNGDSEVNKMVIQTALQD